MNATLAVFEARRLFLFLKRLIFFLEGGIPLLVVGRFCALPLDLLVFLCTHDNDL